jgi:endonuclease/exonuclease/phosphatase family metal-dependent hydrolase
MTEQAGLTVVTWNAQGSHGLDIGHAAAGLAALVPDLVLLQEVQRHQLGALGVALGALDARWRFKHWPVRTAAEGLGLLAWGAVASVRTQVLAHRWQIWNWRRRVALHAALAFGEGTVRVVDVHLGAGVTHDERSRQVRTLLDASSDAAVVAGDLNAEPASPELALLAAEGWDDAETRVRPPDVPRPSTNWPPGPRGAPPTQRLDYVLVRPETAVLHAFVPDDWERWAELSDHLPVVARLRL